MFVRVYANTCEQEIRDPDSLGRRDGVTPLWFCRHITYAMKKESDT